jgi:hypothetical protein
MDQPTASWRFRFGLRTLLVLVTLAALGSWGYLIGWPSWCNREFRSFVAAVKQLKTGASLVDSGKVLQSFHYSGPEFVTDPHGGLHCLRMFDFPNSWDAYYFVCLSYPDDSPAHLERFPSTKVEVFRVPRGSVGFFSQFICADQREFTGFGYELIYSDPPAMPAVAHP